MNRIKYPILTILLAVFLVSCEEEEVLNYNPDVVIEVEPQFGTVETTFTAIVTDISDKDDPVSSLQLRYNWGDGNGWSEYTKEQSATYLYSRPGIFTVKCEVIDSEGWMGYHKYEVEVEPVPNHPPGKPILPVPNVNATEVPVNTTLSWFCTDEDGDHIYFDVYLSRDPNNLGLPVSENQPGMVYDPPKLEKDAFYWWKIVARDEHGLESEGFVWSFNTETSK